MENIINVDEIKKNSRIILKEMPNYHCYNNDNGK